MLVTITNHNSLNKKLPAQLMRMKKMNKEQYNEIVSWQDATFAKATAHSKICHLKQEVQELENEILKDSSIRVEDEMFEELADCFILLFGAAGCMKMSYEEITEAINKKMVKNKSRVWGQPDANGVVNHVKQTIWGVPIIN
jgi:NTP pyrophosphatase (non-canonical NTP hydrolase)